MAKPDKERQPDDKKGSPPDAAAWGTWEELLLAYAVNRFGTDSWASVSSELRKRSSAQIRLTPYHCEQKYLELQRRFAKSTGDDGGEAVSTAAVPWIEELRELRVEELQRELKNFDIYITSLQSKVKRLTEESAKNGCAETKKSDLGQKNEIQFRDDESVKYNLPDPVISGEEQLPTGNESDDQSMNGSNGNLDTGAEKPENESDSSPVWTGDEKPESFGGGPEAEPVKIEPESRSEGTTRNNWDEQSAASKSKEGSDSVRRGCSKADESDNEDQSRDSIPVRSLPLIDILQKVNKLGSAVFERRLDRQEKMRYKNLVRENIDFKILQTRLKEGRYSDGNNKFFRDLLLLVNNTLVFFSCESPEHAAANHLRHFVLKEMTSKRKQKTDSKSTIKQSSSKPTNPPLKRASEPPDSMLLKPKLAGPMTVCRKRSSIAAKESWDVKSEPKKEKKVVDVEEKKQSAAKFLNRMKQSSSAAASNEAAGGGSGDDGKKEQAAKRSSGGRQLKEPDSPARRNVGRPPKRAAAVLGKRNTECGESETTGLKQTKKRTKR